MNLKLKDDYDIFHEILTFCFWFFLGSLFWCRMRVVRYGGNWYLLHFNDGTLYRTLSCWASQKLVVEIRSFFCPLMACLDNQVTCETTRYILCPSLLFLILCTLRPDSFRISFCVLWIYASDVILHVLLILKILILCIRRLSILIYLISWSTTSSAVDFHFFL